MKSIAVLVCIFAVTTTVFGATFETPNYTVNITSKCKEGDVACDNVIYLGVSKKSGAEITLKGTTLHTSSRDGSPSRFLGYKFKNGNITYLVLESGTLEVIRGESEVLLSEEGIWKY